MVRVLALENLLLEPAFGENPLPLELDLVVMLRTTP
jgi:hypothetical protein